MVRSDIAVFGVMFTLDTESGFRDVVVINGAWGLGEAVVQGMATPDEWIVFKPTLKLGFRPIVSRKLGVKEVKMVFADDGTRNAGREVVEAQRNRFCLAGFEVLQLAQWACAIEEHYSKLAGKPSADGYRMGEGRHHRRALYSPGAAGNGPRAESREQLHRNLRADRRTRRSADVGRRGRRKDRPRTAHVMLDPAKLTSFKEGEILVTSMTDPAWEPIMKRASAIVTDRGGRTCHSAIISRELGIPCIVGTGNATEELKNGTDVTVSCAEGDDGNIYYGKVDFKVKKHEITDTERPRTQVMMNVGDPDHAFAVSRLPNDGVGLARLEFIINNHIGIHPMALVQLSESQNAAKISRRSRTGFCEEDPKEFFVRSLAEGIGRIAAAFYPKPVIVRMSDFKSNEYAMLIGGREFEPIEENPMIGFRGASRYYDDRYKDGFKLECLALLRVREDMGLTNVKPMIPFCRTVEEGEKVIALMAEHGLIRARTNWRSTRCASCRRTSFLPTSF